MITALSLRIDLGSHVARNLSAGIDAVGVPIAERMWAATGYQCGFSDQYNINSEPLGDGPRYLLPDSPTSARKAGGARCAASREVS